MVHSLLKDRRGGTSALLSIFMYLQLLYCISLSTVNLKVENVKQAIYIQVAYLIAQLHCI